MKIVNLDGMALVGPGSEWLWTAVSGLVLGVTFIAIYRQLRLQRSASAIDLMSTLERDWTTERMARSRLAVLLAIRDGTDGGRLPTAASDPGDFWERVGYLVRRRHIEERLVHEYFSHAIQKWWEWLRPHAVAERDRRRAPELYEHFEWLAHRMADLDRRSGRPVELTHLREMDVLATEIGSNLECIRAGEEMRTVIVRGAAPSRVEGAGGIAPNVERILEGIASPNAVADGRLEVETVDGR